MLKPCRRWMVFSLALAILPVDLPHAASEVEEVGKQPVQVDFPSGGSLKMDLCSSGVEIVLHVSLTELAARLDPERFIQVHRSHIVNLDAVRLLRPHDDRRLLLVLVNGEEIVASRSTSELLRKQVR